MCTGKNMVSISEFILLFSSQVFLVSCITDALFIVLSHCASKAIPCMIL